MLSNRSTLRAARDPTAHGELDKPEVGWIEDALAVERRDVALTRRLMNGVWSTRKGCELLLLEVRVDVDVETGDAAHCLCMLERDPELVEGFNVEGAERCGP
jgi:hypothetical protein